MSVASPKVGRTSLAKEATSMKADEISYHNEAMRFLDAINRRDLNTLRSILATDVEQHSMAWSSPLRGVESVLNFYTQLASSMDERAQIQVDDATGGGPSSLRVAVLWHFHINNVELPFSKVLSMYTFMSTGKLQIIRDAPEHIAKAPTPILPALSLTTPLINIAAPFISIVASASPSERKVGSVTPSEALSAVPSTSRNSGGTVVMRKLAAPQGVAVESNGVVDSQPNTNGTVIDVEANTKPLLGTWTKDLERTDVEAYNQALDVLGIGGIQKYTANTLNDLELDFDARTGNFDVKFLTFIPYYKIIETYQVGKTLTMSRRDLQPGTQTAKTRIVSGGVDILIQWGDPNAGQQLDQYRIVNANEMHLFSEVSNARRKVDVLTVFTRQV